MSERKKVIKTTNLIFIKNEDQQRMSVFKISKSAELQKAQQEKAQQIKISSLDNNHVSENNDENITENNSDENDENSISIDRVSIQTSEKNDDDSKLEITT